MPSCHTMGWEKPFEMARRTPATPTPLCRSQSGGQPVVGIGKIHSPASWKHGVTLGSPFFPCHQNAPPPPTSAFARDDPEQKAVLGSIYTWLLVQTHLGTRLWMPTTHPTPPSEEPGDGALAPFRLSASLVLPLPASEPPQLWWSFQHGLLPGPPFWGCLAKGGPS